MVEARHVRSRHPLAPGALVACLLAACLAASGCSIQRMALRRTGGVLRTGAAALNEEPDYELARAAMAPNLKTLEVLLASDPENPDVLFLLAQGYGAYAYLMLEDELDLADAAGDVERVKVLKQRAAALYARAQGFALRLLGGEELRRTLEGTDLERVNAAAKAFTVENVPALFWYAYAWVGRINLDQSNPARIAELPRVEILMNRVVQLDPSYYNGLPLLTSGALYAGRAAMFGGDLGRGKALFEQGIAVTDGKFLLGKFLLARYYAVQAQDPKLFCSLLQEVATAPPDLLPAQQLMNNVSQRWALRWKERAVGLFEGADGGCNPPVAPAPAGKVEEDDGMLLH